MTKRSAFSALAIVLLANATAHPAPPTDKASPRPDISFLGPPAHRIFQASDTLAPGPETSLDARKCLEGLTWTPGKFRVRCETPTDGHGEVLLRFPSPIRSGHTANDLVAVEWYVAGLKSGPAQRSRAVVVVHESGRGMTVGRLFAATLRREGLHAFLVQLPGYGHRVSPGERLSPAGFFDRLRQAIADVRRTRDAISALPLVDTSHVSLQGTSLGGFVVATSGSLDTAYDSLFVMLAGGNLYQTLLEGKRDTASIRKKLAGAGITGKRLKKLTLSIEPTRLAHRLDPQRTWLFSGIRDTVVPMKSALALAQSARLADNHHVMMPTDHYTGIVLLPSMCRLIARQIKTLPSRTR
ncbi:hypothetical protein OAJ60_01685 [Planctomycetaceae bacterium]|nr:hypothetical protein [Planctomycetaceae bacterium]